LKKLQKKTCFIFLFGLFLNIYNIHSQNSNETSTYNWFDKTIGIESLDFKNGPAHLNFDKMTGDQNRYYATGEFKKGNINYNNQNYSDLLLKYDILMDELVLKPYAETNYTQINLIKENVNFFKIGNEKFVNLKANTANYKSGYYEETLISDNVILYTRHYKKKNNVTKDNVFMIEFIEDYDFILLKDNKFILVNDKNEIIKLYPAKKSKINDFFYMNRNLKKDDPSLFMKNLMKYINNLNL
jgi:hypothetical protein